MAVKKPPMTFRDEITDFFNHYVDAFTREDADALSKMG